jgi:hypothetical protein
LMRPPREPSSLVLGAQNRQKNPPKPPGDALPRVRPPHAPAAGPHQP